MSPYRNSFVLDVGARSAVHLVRTEPRARRFVRTVVGVLALLVVASFFVPWQQTSFAQGRVIAYAPLDRRQSLEAPIEGRIVSWEVREGSHVEQGDLIAVLSDNDPELLARMRFERSAVEDRLSAAQTRVASLEDRVFSLENSRTVGFSAAGSRAQMARERANAAERALDAAMGTEKTARLNQERQRKLVVDGLASQRQVELADLDFLRASTEVERAKAAFSAAKSENVALLSDQNKFRSDASAQIRDAEAAKANALAEVANARAELTRIDTRLSRQASQRITAPRAGTVLHLLVAQGTEMVKAGDPIAVLVPDSEDRAVELYVDGNDLPLVTDGRHVRLQFEGWPAVQFSGWPQVAVGTFGGEVAIVDAADDGKGKFRIVVRPAPGEPWPETRYLRQGVRAQGFVVLGRVSVAYEIWRKLNGFPASVDAPPPKTTVKEGKGK